MPAASISIKEVAAIFFDFGDTLATLAPSREELFARAARSIGLELDGAAIQRAYQVVDFHNKFSSVHVKDRTAFYDSFNRQLADALGIASHLAQLGPAVVSEFKNHKSWQLFPEVPHVLNQLKEMGCRLGLVANWDRDLEDLTEKLGIGSVFSCVVASASAGVEKPDAAIFLEAAAKLSVNPASEKIIYVGNEYVADVVGARAAGLIPVLIDRTNSVPHADCLRFESLTAWLAGMLK